jgi:hypothetical protein
MSTVQEIERAIRDLSPSDLAELHDWIVAFAAQQWDREIEHDAQSGRLDALAAEALADLQEGRCSDL